MGTTLPLAATAVPPTLFISDADVEQLADWASAVQALRVAVIGSGFEARGLLLALEIGRASCRERV